MSFGPSITFPLHPKLEMSSLIFLNLDESPPHLLRERLLSCNFLSNRQVPHASFQGRVPVKDWGCYKRKMHNDKYTLSKKKRVPVGPPYWLKSSLFTIFSMGRKSRCG